MTLTLDKAYIHARTVSYIHSKGSPSENRSRNESTEDNQLSYYASAEGKPCEAVPRLRYFIGQTKKIGNAIRKLCCFPSENQPPLGQNRVCPQKQGTERVFIEKAAGTDKVHLCLVLPSLLCAGSSSVSPFRFPKIVSFSHSVSTF